METTAKKMKKTLVCRYHTLCNKLGLSRDDCDNMLEPYGVKSSLDLSLLELQEICNKLDVLLRPKLSEADKWRKRVMASVGGWLKMIGHEQSAARIHAIACRASGFKSFNEIPIDRLRNLYYAFLNKQNDFSEVGRIAVDEYEILSSRN